MIGNERLILVGGPGGVGKTTVAATLGVRLAEKGNKTLVLTVDPARRLAQALGFDGFSSDVQKVDGLTAGSGELYATMLDTNRYFDKIIERFSANANQKEKILNNPIYRTMVESLGGTHEYAAMERLYELSLDTTYDKIVVDTPPMQNAVDLLKAPERLAAFMDNSVLRWFQGTPSFSRRILQTGTRVAVKMMRSLLGPEFLESFQELMNDFEGLQYGFQERHKAVQRLLSDSRTGFLIVTNPSPERFRESLAFREALKVQGIFLKGVILNRLEPAVPAYAFIPGGLSESEQALVETWTHFHRHIWERQTEWTKGFQKSLGATPLRIIPRETEMIHSLASLSRLGALLIS